jgi:hypothetical protein
MTANVTVQSGNALVLGLVGDYARGLGCVLDASPPGDHPAIRITIAGVDERLVEVLTHVALSCIKAGVDVTEPLCEVTCRHPGVSSDVRLSLRVADFHIDTATSV